MAHRQMKTGKSRRLTTILLVGCIAAVIVLVASLSPLFVQKYSIAVLTEGVDYYFVYDDGRGRQYVISALVKKDRTITEGYIERPVMDIRAAGGSEPLEQAHPEVLEKISKVFDLIAQKAAAYRQAYPNIRVVDCMIQSFTQDEIIVVFEGLGVAGDGSYQTIRDAVTQKFGI